MQTAGRCLAEGLVGEMAWIWVVMADWVGWGFGSGRLGRREGLICTQIQRGEDS